METRPARRKRILLVDDEVQNLELLEACLEPLGHETVRAQAGTDAIAFLDHAAFDLVLLDIMMPGATGFEVLRRYREKPTQRFVPVVLLTALIDRASRLRGLELGASDLMSKPIDRAELLARVRALLHLQDTIDALLEQTHEVKRLKAAQRHLALVVARELKAPLERVDGQLAWLRENCEGADPLRRIDDSRDTTARMMETIVEIAGTVKSTP